MSALDAIETALNDRLKTLTGFDANNCAWFGVPYTPVPKTPYLAARLVGAARSVASIGRTPCIRWDGTYQVSAFYPAAKGTRAVNQRIDQIIDHFPAGAAYAAAPLLTPGVRIIVASPEGSALPDGQWIQGVARISFYAHEIQT